LYVVFCFGCVVFCVFFRGFFCLLYFLYFEEVFDEVLVEEKKRVGIIMSDRKLLLFFLGYQKVFDPKNNSFLLLFFCLS